MSNREIDKYHYCVMISRQFALAITAGLPVCLRHSDHGVSSGGQRLKNLTGTRTERPSAGCYPPLCVQVILILTETHLSERSRQVFRLMVSLCVQSSSSRMADDLDIEAMLEAPYRKEDAKASSPNGQEDRTKRKKRSRDRKRSRSRDRKRSRERKRSRSRDKRRSRSRERRGSRERGGRYRDHHKHRRRSKSKSPFKKEKSPIRQPIDNLTPEERDARTVFCMQLAARIRPRDLEDFFSAVGKVRDVRMISDRNSRRSKGIAYIEFVEASSVPLAIGLTGQRLLGVPIIVQASQAEKNRAAAAANNLQKGSSGPMRLYVGSLHFNITEEMLRGIFEPFGRIESIQLMMDSETGRSKGYGFITFADAECAKKALEQLNGFELAGRPMKVGHVTERTDAATASSFLDNDDMERSGIDLGTTGRLQLMARLAEGSGLQIPPAAQQALQMSGAIAIGAMAAVSAAMNPTLNMNSAALNLPSQPLATHCFQLSNMFSPNREMSTSSARPSLLPWPPSTLYTEDSLLVR
ncbi:RNA-binding protein 39-like isoform X5 [Micropterus dolomieu]|uniref:RNA-binding protein 39-like isoform X5 n=1 Tax=Micropterus dolomieu TaxID=147949 RepID=UPI001E8DB81F|nr:RNA-binding protein 39-like isoform X5 [Micropterus dolomieu]